MPKLVADGLLGGVPRLIDYPDVLQTLAGQGLRCVYPNSGAFDFGDATPEVFGFGHAADPSLRPAFADKLAISDRPLAPRLIDAWKHLGATEAWLMPVSHWAYELQHGNRELLRNVLADLDVDELSRRVDGSAIAFGISEASELERITAALLAGLHGSDFAVAFPGSPTLATIHHHGQLWFRTTDERLTKGFAEDQR